MKPIDGMERMRRTLLIIAATAAAALMSGCVYRPTIQQGNLLKYEDIEQVKVGMTRSQVRYVLGTPMVSDPFEPNRWDYVYTLQVGRGSRVDRAHVVVFFEGDKVSKVEKLGASAKPAAAPDAMPATPVAPAAPATTTPPAALEAPAPSPASVPPDAGEPPVTTPPPGGG
jgi:outer membrane protein assembly factor BamE